MFKLSPYTEFEDLSKPLFLLAEFGDLLKLLLLSLRFSKTFTSIEFGKL